MQNPVIGHKPPGQINLLFPVTLMSELQGHRALAYTSKANKRLGNHYPPHLFRLQSRQILGPPRE